MKMKKAIERRALGAMAWAVCSVLAAPLAAPGATANVTIVDFAFNPSTTTINANDSVKWTWDASDTAPHSTTSNSSLWDSGQLSAGATFTHAFPSAGSFSYHCSVHTFMTASVTVNAADVPPTVTITNPANGAVLTAPATFAVSARASDSDGTVSSVQFFQGAASLGTKTTLPYSVTVSNLGSGSYTFSAVATDNAGLKATNSITVAVNAPPTASITAPTNGATFSAPWTGTIRATDGDTDDTVSKVQFFAGGSLMGTVTNPPASPSLTVTNLAAGNYLLTAVATDNRGAAATSAVVNVSVVTPVPIVLSSANRVAASAFRFNFSANAGLSYEVLRGTGLTNFTPIATNTATNSAATFLDNGASGAVNYYRVRLQPNP